ncbi:MAG TPA: acetoacetate--CoA ligase [Baekduia sp.]|uniref:acetoacetate--CoA ligase n=1 Tax=Baekduia sp. TaxID=2600305 RepID=UPI002B9FF57C|nr:acetoacetate--CoA ligase [Baekduia sp.]HMJ34759.1 acetoacetate--CoA ligase [Baekduia sp.]
MESAEPKVLWTPTSERVEHATITRFARWVSATRAVDVTGSYDALWQWSVDDLEGFWAAIWEFFDVQAQTPYERVLGSRDMPGAEWFPGARLSYAEHVFRGKQDADLALQHASETRELDWMTWGELRDLTARIATGLRLWGVGPGDRVVAYLPNIPEAIAAFLACASLGATWSSCSPDFGTRSVVDRFSQIEPKVLLAVDGYRYGGKDFDRRDVVAALAREIPSLEHVVLLDYLGSGEVEGAVPWGELIQQQEPLDFAQLPFDHPLWVLYSSGTTGLPKPIVHGQGGILLEHLKKMHLHLDAQAGDRVFWFTTTGWMMWNFLAGVLLTPASIVLYDGNPATPTLDRLWDLAADTGTTTFGTSASFLATCQKEGVEPTGGSRDLGALKSVGSTGSPLSPEGFEWVYEHVGADTWLFSTSGGTDVCTAFVGGVPTLPVYLGELQCRALGADVQSWDPEGRDHLGEVGELVLTEPMPSMPICFWGDEDGQRLRESYFDTYAGVWRHGDWIEITDRGTAIIYGRSDSTINRGGIRMGTSEIYRAVLADDAVVDALVVDIPREGTEGWMPLFVVLREGEELTDELIARLRKRIREECSPRHVPNEIRQIAEVPRTLSGKVLEVPVKRILMGQPADQAASRDSLANPAALDVFVELARGG